MTIAAYQRTAQTTENPVEREIRAFIRVVAKLEAADRSNLLTVIPAVHENDRLWTVLQAEIASPDNALPAQLRANLFALSLWAQRHGAAVMAGTADLQPLIDINKEIAAGLLAQQRKAAAVDTTVAMANAA